MKVLRRGWVIQLKPGKYLFPRILNYWESKEAAETALNLFKENDPKKYKKAVVTRVSLIVDPEVTQQ